MSPSVALMPLRFNESDQTIVVPKTVWTAMLTLSARFHCPVQDHLPPRPGKEFATALTRGLAWLDTTLQAPGSARDEKLAATLSLLTDPAVRAKVQDVVVMCQMGRGLHFCDRVSW